MTTMEILQAARNCAPILASADTALKNKALLAMASALEAAIVPTIPLAKVPVAVPEFATTSPLFTQFSMMLEAVFLVATVPQIPATRMFRLLAVTVMSPLLTHPLR